MNRPATRLVVVVIAAVLATASYQRLRAGSDRAQEPGGPAPGVGEVVRVVDGDTVVVRVRGAEERVRLLGIDTPESVDPRRPVECFGKEAARHTASLLPSRSRVRLVRDVEARDAYGRLLAYVYRLPDDEHVNLRLVRDGYAQVLTHPPNVAHAAEFVAAAAEAREARRGLWSACPTARAGQDARSRR